MFFIINFVMDYVAIWLFKNILHIRRQGLKCCLFAAVLAILPIIIIRFKVGKIEAFALEVLVVTGGILWLIRDRYKKILRYVILFFCIFMILGGVGTFLYENTVIGYIMHEKPVLFFIAIISAAFLIRYIVMIFEEKNVIYKNNIWDVKIKDSKISYMGRGLYDSGNTLVDPYIRRGISIVEADRLKIEGNINIHYVPYTSLGNQHGLIKVTKVDSIELFKDNEKLVVYEALIGLYEGSLACDDYSMIINSTIFDGRDNNDNENFNTK